MTTPPPPSAQWLRYFVPSKLNLFLHINGQRADGYHQLQTFFQLLNIGEHLDIRVTAHSDLVIADDVALPKERHLVWQAAQRLHAHTASPYGAQFRVLKRIPMGAGLGGGSADAAITLLALNQLWGCQLSLSTLADIGLQLGADVPVFIHGYSAWACGLGEQLTALSAHDRLYRQRPAAYVILTPPCHADTRALFQHPDLPRNTPALPWADFDMQHNGHNDFTALALRLWPDLHTAFEALSAAVHSLERPLQYPAFSTPRLTGSGSSCFIGCPNLAQAQRLSQYLYTCLQWQPAEQTDTPIAPPGLSWGYHRFVDREQRLWVLGVAAGIEQRPALKPLTVTMP